MTMLDPRELLGLTPPRRIAGEGVRASVDGERMKRRVRRTPQYVSPEKKREYNRRWEEKNPEKARAMRLAGARRYYWKDVEKSREHHRKRMAGKQAKAAMTPDEWRRRLDLAKAAKVRRETSDPSIRERRLAKGRAYWAAKKGAKT